MLTFGNPSGAWFFLAAAAVIALYMYYRRYRPQRVTGLFLWGAPRRDASGGRRRERLLTSRAFWFDLAAALLLAFALTEPRWTAPERTAVIILDNAIAMLSRDNHLEAIRVAEEIAANARQTAVIFPALPEPKIARALAPAGGREFGAWLDGNYFPDSPFNARLGRTAGFAKDLYGDGIRLHIITNQDGAEELAAPGTTVHTLAGRGKNIAFSNLWRRSEDDAETIMMLFRSYGEEADAEVVVSTAVDGAEIASHPLRIGPAGKALAVSVAGHKQDMLRIEVKAEEDSIAADSIAYLPPSEPGRPVVAITDVPAAARKALEAAFLAAGCFVSDKAATAELLVTGGAEAKGTVATLRLPKEDSPALARPPYRVDAETTLCRDIDLSDAVWTVAAPARPAWPTETCIEVGDTPLYWREGEDTFVLNLLPDRGNFAHTPAWPVLVENLSAFVETLRPGVPKGFFRPGETVRVRGGKALLRRGDEVVAETTGGVMRLPDAAGVYGFAYTDEKSEYGKSIAVLPLYDGASDTRKLSARASTTQGGDEQGRADARTDLRLPLFLLAAALLGWNWHKP